MAAKPQRIANLRHRLPAALALFAILLQAILFGWHSHALQFAGNGRAPAVVASAGIELPASADEDGCEICSVLHHQSASGALLAAAPAVPDAPGAPAAGAAARAARPAALAFHARAPPLV